MDWTEDEHVVYPGPPAAPAPKDDAADEPDNDPNDPADDDQCEHGDESDENAMPKKEEDESDDESKAPKDQTAVLRDSGLGASTSGHGVGVGASVGAVVSNPSVRLGTGIPLPTQLPSMEVLGTVGG